MHVPLSSMHDDRSSDLLLAIFSLTSNLPLKPIPFKFTDRLLDTKMMSITEMRRILWEKIVCSILNVKFVLSTRWDSLFYKGSVCSTKKNVG